MIEFLRDTLSTGLLLILININRDLIPIFIKKILFETFKNIISGTIISNRSKIKQQNLIGRRQHSIKPTGNVPSMHRFRSLILIVI